MTVTIVASQSGLQGGFPRVPDRLNIADLIVSRWVREGRGGRPALSCGPETWTYAELDAQANRAGNALRKLGLGLGDRFLIRASNSLPYTAALLGGMKIGAVPIPSSTQFQASEVEHTLVSSDTRLALVGHEIRGPLDAVAGRAPLLEQVLELETEFAALAEQSSEELEVADTHRDDPAYAIYTSGTTGAPKGIEHAHRIIVAAGDPVCEFMLALDPEDNVLVPIELSSMITLDFSIFWPLKVGARGTLLAGSFDPERFLAEVERLGVTVFMGVPAMFRALLAVPDATRRYDLSSVRMPIVGGEPLPDAIPEAVREHFGWELHEIIGSTEAHPYIGNPAGRPPVPGSLGVAYPGRPVAICDERGAELPAGEIGHICLRADDPAIALGYRKQERAWRELFRHGWFYTGDLARRDEEGRFWFVSRADELILSQAHRISPEEVERAVARHPAVNETAVVGIPDRRGGQLLKAFVVLEPGLEPSEALGAEIRRSVQGVIAAYKWPRAVEFVGSLPKTGNGKIQRAKLREREVRARVARSAHAAKHEETIEATLARIWADVLEVESVEQHDDFFELGGDSVAAAEAAVAASEALGEEIPLGLFAEHTTIAAIAHAIRSRDAAAYDTVVALQPLGTEAPFFCIPGGANLDVLGGGALEPLPLARLAGRLAPDRPFFAVQPPDRRSYRALRSIRALAAYYLARIKEVEERPIVIGGYCVGAAVAFEMARQLAAEGTPPAAVVLIEPPNLKQLKRRKVLRRRAAGLYALVAAHVRVALDRFAPVSPGVLGRYRNMILHPAVQRYEPKRLRSQLTIISARDGHGGERVWKRAGSNGFRLAVIPGDHHSVLREPDVDALAAALRDALAEVTPAP